MNKNLLTLIPPQILIPLTSHTVDLEIHLVGKQAKSSWPSVKISIDQKEIYNGIVIEEQTISAKTNTNEEFSIQIEYYGKKDFDTVSDDNGIIIENQSIEIKKIIVNNVDLIKTKLIYKNIGCYTMLLTPYKEQELKKYNQSTEPSTNLTMYENGIWKINLKQPLYTFLSSLWYTHEDAEIVDIPKIKQEIHDRLNNCLEIVAKNA